MVINRKERAISKRTLPDETRYADDFKRMSARKLVYRFMVFAPAIFLVGLGVHARTMSRDFEFVENDAQSEHLILAYVPYLRESAILKSKGENVDPAAARTVAKQWIAGANSGLLKPLAPAVYEDTSSDGVKSQVFDAAERIERSLVESGITAAGQGNYHQATTDELMAIKFSGILKYSDFLSLYNSAKVQRQAIQLIKTQVGKLDAKDKIAVTSVLADLEAKPTTLEVMIRRSKQLFMNWRYKQGEQPLSIEDSQLLSDIPALAKNGTLVAMKEMRDRILASKDDHVPTYVSSLRVGISSQDLVTRDAKGLTALLNSTKFSH